MASEQAAVNFGSKLREARERRGVTLRQIANATKISVSFLEALERNDISRLPGGIFSRAFVRSYAVEVGLDPEQTIQEFIAQFPNDSVTAGHPKAEQIEDHDALESDRRMATTFLRLIAVSIPLVGVVLYFGTAASRAPEPEAPRQVAVSPAPVTPTPAPVGPAPESEAVSAATGADPAPPQAAAVADETGLDEKPVPGTAAAANRVVVVATVSRPCWVAATVDGQKSVDRVLQAGDTQTFDVGTDLVLRVGDAGAITLTLNGTPARPLGKAGEVVTIRLSPASFRDYLPAR